MHLQQIRRSKLAVVGIKAVHTLAWFSVESGMIYLLYTGLMKRSDRRAAIAAAVVGAESLIFAANGFRCPLTTLAEQFGAERGSVTDIYLPGWFAHNLPAIHVPLLVLAAFLHVKNFEANSASSSANVVSIRTCVLSRRARISRVASMPLPSARRTSMTTTSGFVSNA